MSEKINRTIKESTFCSMQMIFSTKQILAVVVKCDNVLMIYQTFEYGNTMLIVYWYMFLQFYATINNYKANNGYIFIANITDKQSNVYLF